MKLPPVVECETADDAASSVSTTVGEPMKTLHSVPK